MSRLGARAAVIFRVYFGLFPSFHKVLLCSVILVRVVERAWRRVSASPSDLVVEGGGRCTVKIMKSWK